MANRFTDVIGVFRPQKKLAALTLEMDGLETRVFEYKSYYRYLQRRERATWLTKTGHFLKRIEGLNHWLFVLNRRNGVSLRSLRSRGNAVKIFLEEFDIQYVRAEV